MGISKEYLRLVSNNINDLIFILNSNLIIEDINERVHFQLLGYSKEEIVGKLIKKFLPIKDYKKIKKIIEDLDIIKQELVNVLLLHKTGNYIWHEGKIESFLSKEGEKKILVIFKDITERKQVELIIKDSKEKYQSIIRNIKEGYYEVDLKGKFTYANDALCKFLGYSREELLGKSFKITTVKKTSDIVFETFNKVYRTEIEKNIFQFQVIRKNGDNAFFETSVYLKYDSKGKKIGFYGIVRDITRRKEEEKKKEVLEEQFKIKLAQTVRLKTNELKESEEKYSNLFQHSNDGIFFHDLDGNIMDVNQKVLEQFGYTKNEILSLKVPQLHPISEQSESKKAFEEISKKGFIRFEINFKKKNGEIFPAEVSSSLFSIGDKKFIQGIMRDITLRKQSEENLRESEKKYRNMINNLDLGFYQVNWNGDLLNHNPAFNQLLGYERNENLANINVLQFWQMPEEREKYLDELRSSGSIQNYTVHSKKKDGQNIVLQLNSHLIKDENDNPIKIQGLISDITEKFELERKVKESEIRYRNLIESVPFSIALVDQKGVVIYCNPATERLLGYSEEELIGHEFRKLPLINPKFLPEMLKRFGRVSKGEKLPPFETELYTKDGNLIWINYQTSLVKLGENFLIQAILYDTTERRKADLLVQQEIEKLKELDQIRKDLISRVSHELKTPLVSVCGASELLLELFRDDIKEDTIELIEMIEKGGTRLKHLVDNLLNITRIEYNKFKLEMNFHNLSDVVRDVSNELNYLIKRRQLELRLDLPDKLIFKFDRLRIEQVILNLLSNSIKNTPPMGKIYIKLIKNGSWAELLVKDTGIGLTREEMARIFSRFGKIERYGEGLEYIDIQGSGLGLYISKEIIDLHKGKIWSASAGRDKGSTFTVKLPINEKN
ncbi:MAG: PAS domain S-box protein [Promethearchaeota archaeon]